MSLLSALELPMLMPGRNREVGGPQQAHSAAAQQPSRTLFRLGDTYYCSAKQLKRQVAQRIAGWPTLATGPRCALLCGAHSTPFGPNCAASPLPTAPTPPCVVVSA